MGDGFKGDSSRLAIFACYSWVDGVVIIDTPFDGKGTLKRAWEVTSA
jgi:hypothetical protein